MTSVRLHRLLLVVSVLVPTTVFVAAAAWNRSEVLRENEETITRTTAILHEHARKVFDTVELVIGRVDDRVQGMTWDEISKPGTSAFLQQLKAPLNQVVSIWVTDANGRVQAGSQPWDPNVTIAEREWFKAQKDRDAGSYISSAFEGKATQTASFAYSRRRSTPDGRFDGIIHVALSPEYFARFYQEAVPEGETVAALIRQDGEILARFPFRAVSSRLPAASPLMRGIEVDADGGEISGRSALDGRDRIYAYRRVAPYPVYVTHGVDRAAVMQRWYDNMLVYGAVAALSSLTLLLVSWLALRRAQAEQQALLRLRRESEQRVIAEQQLLQSQKMESLGQLTGGIAHDFNNLLSVILGNLDLLRKRVSDDRAGRLLEGAIQGAQSGAALTQRLLAFSRRQDLTPQAVDISSLVGSMTDLLSRSLGPNIRIVTRFPPDLPTVRADPNQLELALLNLAVNARDAMPISGTISVSARAADVAAGEIQGLEAGSYVCVAVSDTGLGMDAATLARAVEPFFTTKGIGKGTGLGLSMIHGFAVQSGGTFRLTSVVGQGTTAEIWPPQGDDLPASEPVGEPARHEHRSCRILLVEDDPLVLSATTAMLEDLGHTVTAAATGEEALTILKADHAFDLTITDYAMPGVTGLELAKRIRAEWPDIPLLLASGRAELQDEPDADIPRLAKPLRRDDVGSIIASLVAPDGEPANVVPLKRAW
jgi:signal transduction histidine kinase